MAGFFTWIFQGCWHKWKTTDKREWSVWYYERTCQKCGRIQLVDK